MKLLMTSFEYTSDRPRRMEPISMPGLRSYNNPNYIMVGENAWDALEDTLFVKSYSGLSAERLHRATLNLSIEDFLIDEE